MLSALLIKADKSALLTELYGVLWRSIKDQLRDKLDIGEEFKVAKNVLIGIVRLFAGVSLDFPSVEQLEKAARDAEIYIVMKRGDPKLAQVLADKYELSTDYVTHVYYDVVKYLEENFNVSQIG